MQTKEIPLWSKASPKQRYEKFASSLDTNDFVVSNSNSCVYSKKNGSGYVIKCLYVDDMLRPGKTDPRLETRSEQPESILEPTSEMKTTGFDPNT